MLIKVCVTFSDKDKCTQVLERCVGFIVYVANVNDISHRLM